MIMTSCFIDDQLSISLDSVECAHRTTVKIIYSIRGILNLFSYDATLTEYLVAAWSNCTLFSWTSVKRACSGEIDCNELKLEINISL